MTRMIPDVEAPPDQNGHAVQGPELGGVAGRLRALRQPAHEPALLSRGQPRRPPGGGLGAQASRPRPLVGVPPAEDGTHRGAHRPRHSRQTLASLEQPDGLSAPPFQLRWHAGRSHTAEHSTWG